MDSKHLSVDVHIGKAPCLATHRHAEAPTKGGSPPPGARPEGRARPVECILLSCHQESAAASSGAPSQRRGACPNPGPTRNQRGGRCLLRPRCLSQEGKRVEVRGNVRVFGPPNNVYGVPSVASLEGGVQPKPKQDPTHQPNHRHA